MIYFGNERFDAYIYISGKTSRLKDKMEMLKNVLTAILSLRDAVNKRNEKCKEKFEI